MTSHFPAHDEFGHPLSRPWIVTLTRKLRSRQVDTRKMYIRAKTREGAIRTARIRCPMAGSARAQASAHVAHPVDLGMQEVRS